MRIHYCLLLFLFLFVCTEARLQFKEDGTFKILQLTDLHFGEKDSLDSKSVKVVGKLLDAEQPDLVVITGDLVSGYAWDRKPGFFHRHYSNAMQPIVDRNVSYAFAFGNHDIEADLSGEEILNIDIQNPSSLTRRGPREMNGITNFDLPVYMPDSDVIGSVVWIFDSGHANCLGVKGWGCIHTDQVSWYKSRSSSLSPNGDIPGYAFFHIPLYEHMDLWNSKEVRGDMSEAEGVCCSSVNTGLFAAIKERGDIKAVFVGHDHNNDYYGDYNGVTLGYGRKTGYGGYGPPFGWKRGARVIEINTNKEMNTWLRLEDGSRTTQKKTRSLFTNKLHGCCEMEGHGRNDGYVIASVVVLGVVPVLVALKISHSCYRKWKAGKREYAQVELEPRGEPRN